MTTLRLVSVPSARHDAFYAWVPGSTHPLGRWVVAARGPGVLDADGDLCLRTTPATALRRFMASIPPGNWESRCTVAATVYGRPLFRPNGLTFLTLLGDA